MGKAGTEEQQGPWESGCELVSRHLTQSKCPTHTRPFPPALGSGSMAEGPREDAEARWESRGARRRVVGTEAVTARTGVTLLPLQPHTTWPGEGTPGLAGLDSSPDSTNRSCVSWMAYFASLYLISSIKWG